VREIEALYLRAIASARHWIYLEDQYFTSPMIGAALATRLAEPHGPEVVMRTAPT
jgi:phospholipase D1/2